MQFDSDYSSLQEKLAAFFREWDQIAAEDKQQLLEVIENQLLLANELLKNIADVEWDDHDRNHLAQITSEAKTRLRDINTLLSARKHINLRRHLNVNYN